MWFKKHGIKFWVIFAEKFGSPTAVGKYPPGMSKPDQDKLLNAIDAIQQEAGITARSVHEKVRHDILRADADLLCECLNNSLIRWIVDFNFPDVAVYPKIWIRTQKEKDLKPLAERDKILVKEIGVPVGEQYFYDTYNIPRPDKADILANLS